MAGNLPDALCGEAPSLTTIHSGYPKNPVETHPLRDGIQSKREERTTQSHQRPVWKLLKIAVALTRLLDVRQATRPAIQKKNPAKKRGHDEKKRASALKTSFDPQQFAFEVPIR